MEPLKPQARRDLLDGPQATPQDLDEYEKLLSQRYARDPNPVPGTQPAPAPAKAGLADPGEARLEALYHKLYP